MLFESITKGIREGESCFTDFTTERMFSRAELKCGRAKTSRKSLVHKKGDFYQSMIGNYYF